MSSPKKNDDLVTVPEPTFEDIRWVRSLDFAGRRTHERKIIEAVRDGHIWRVDWALSQKRIFSSKPVFDINDLFRAEHPESRNREITVSPLFAAVSSGRKDMVRYLVGKGAAVNHSRFFKEAVARRDADTALFLLASGAPVFGNILFCAFENNDVGFVEKVWKTCKDMKLSPSLQDQDGYTLLHYAALRGASARDVQALIDLGLDPLTESQSGSTPLMEAIRKKNRPVVDLLIERKAWTDKHLEKLCHLIDDPALAARFPFVKKEREYRLVSSFEVSSSVVQAGEKVVLTEVFNFRTRDRLTFAREAGKSALAGFARQDFDQISDRASVEAAWKALRAQGGDAPHPYGGGPGDTRRKQALIPGQG